MDDAFCLDDIAAENLLVAENSAVVIKFQGRAEKLRVGDPTHDEAHDALFNFDVRDLLSVGFERGLQNKRLNFEIGFDFFCAWIARPIFWFGSFDMIGRGEAINERGFGQKFQACAGACADHFKFVRKRESHRN